MTAITIKEQLAALDRALKLDPGHYESRRLQVFTYYASRKYDRMREDALAMTILRPRDPLGHSLRAVALRELARYGEAIAEYDEAMVLTPKDSPEYVDLSTQRVETLITNGGITNTSLLNHRNVLSSGPTSRSSSTTCSVLSRLWATTTRPQPCTARSSVPAIPPAASSRTGA